MPLLIRHSILPRTLDRSEGSGSAISKVLLPLFIHLANISSSAHGCEFILLHQPDDDEPFDESTVVKRSDESDEQYLTRKKDAQIYRGRLEAIKLTGDPNIPRGEYTFMAEDIGDEGLVRIAKEDQFKGARIVKSKGQLANRNFMNRTYLIISLAFL